MQTEMRNALNKVEEKDKIIEKLKIRLEKLANSSILDRKNNI